MVSYLHRFMEDESGATAIEYALIAALLAVVCITALTALGSSMSSLFSEIKSKVDGSY